MKKYIKLFNWTFIGIIAYSACQWMIIFILNKSQEYENVGLYTYALALTSPLFIFSFLQLRTVYITKVSDNIELFLKLRLYLLTIVLITTVSFTWISGFNNSYLTVIFSVSIVKFAEGVSDIVYAYYHGKQKMKIISQSMIIRSVSSLLIFLFFYYYYEEFTIAIIFYSLYILVFSLTYDLFYLYYKKANLRIKIFAPSLYWKLFTLAFPMGLVMVIANLSVNFPRYILENRASLEVLGVFGSLIYLITILTKITSSLSQVLAPNLANAFTSNNHKKFKKIAFIGLGINTIIGISLMLFITILGEQSLKIVYTEEYVNYINEFLYLSIFGLLTYVGGFLGNILTSMRIFKIQVYIHISKFIVIAIVSFMIVNEELFGIITAIILGSLYSVIIYSLLILINYKKWRNENE